MSIAACSDSTAPQPQIPPHFAQYLDSLYFATVNDSTLGEDARESRAFAITQFEVGAEYGVAPKPITMTTAGGVERWVAYEYLSVHPQEPGEYSNFLIATRDLTFRTYMYAEYLSDGSVYFAVLNDDDTVSTGASDRAGSSAVSLEGSQACPSPIPLDNPMLAPGNCSTAKFSSSGSIVFEDAPGLERAYRHLSFPVTAFEGERFLYN